MDHLITSFVVLLGDWEGGGVEGVLAVDGSGYLFLGDGVPRVGMDVFCW